MALKSCWLSQNHRGQAVFHFEGVESISEAEKFRGLEVLLLFEQRVSLPAGQYFVSDLIGCSVFENPAALPVVASSPCSLARAPGLLGSFGVGGKGTPLPLDPTKKLVVEGPYRIVRNPMYWSAASVMLGEAAVFHSTALADLVLVFFVGVIFFVLFIEEPALKQKFGAEYEEYCQRVPRWIPRVPTRLSRRGAK